MEALRNKKTGRLLVCEALYEEKYGDTYCYVELTDREYGGQVFVTTDKPVIAILLMDGCCNYPDIRIDFGRDKAKFATTDLEIVEVQCKP